MVRADPPPEALFDFVGRVARAESIEALQARYLDGIGDFIGSFAAGLYVLDPFRRATESFAASSFAAHGVSDFFLSRYEETGRTHDPVLARALAERGAVDNRMLMSARRWRSLEVYEEVFHLHRMTGLMEVPLIAGEEVIGTLNFGRNDSEGPFTARDRAHAEAIARLVAAALESVRERDRLVRERDGIAAALELCSDAVVVTDLRSNSRHMNAAARELLGHLADRDGALDTLMANPARRAQRGGEAKCSEIEVELEDGRPAILRARSVTAAHDGQISVCFLTLLSDSDAAALPVPVAGALTRRERQVAGLAIAGLHDAEIAERLHLSPYTVKQYLRAAYAKFGVRSRVDLVRCAVGHRR